MRMFYPLVAVGHLVLVEAAAQPAPRPDDLIAEWSRLNATCRGNSGDDPQTTKACQSRDALIKRIDRSGWCYGKDGQYAAEYQWHPCTTSSLHSS